MKSIKENLPVKVFIVFICFVIFFQFRVRSYVLKEWKIDANNVTSLAFDDNYIWAGTTEGVVKWDKNTGNYTKYTIADGLTDNYVSQIIIDKVGNMWFLTGEPGIAALNKFDGNKFTTYITDYEFENNFLIKSYNYLIAFDIDLDGTMWFFTTRGEVIKLEGTKWTTYTTRDWLGSNFLIKVGMDVDTVWFGTNGGVSSFDGKNWKTYTTNDGLADNYVHEIEIDADGTIWFGTDRGVSSFDGKNWTTYTTNDGLTDNCVHEIEIDDDGTMWFLTIGGVSSFDGKKWTTYNETDGLISNTVKEIIIDSDGNKWFLTYEGLSKFDGVNWTTYTTEIEIRSFSTSRRISIIVLLLFLLLFSGLLAIPVYGGAIYLPNSLIAEWQGKEGINFGELLLLGINAPKNKHIIGCFITTLIIFEGFLYFDEKMIEVLITVAFIGFITWIIGMGIISKIKIKYF